MIATTRNGLGSATTGRHERYDVRSYGYMGTRLAPRRGVKGDMVKGCLEEEREREREGEAQRGGGEKSLFMRLTRARVPSFGGRRGKRDGGG